MKTTLNTVRVGLFFVLGLALIWITYETLSQGSAFRDESYTLEASFETVQMLRAGDDVRMSGVRIGRVAETRLENGTATTILEISHKVRIARDSVATIAISSMLGANYVSIEAGNLNRGYLEEGDEITTHRSTELNEIFASLGEASEQMQSLFAQVSDALTRITGTEEETGILDNFNEIMGENRETIRSTLANVENITGKIDRGEGTLARLLNDDTAYDSLLATISEIQDAASDASTMMDGANEIFAHVKRGEGTLGMLIYNEELGRELEEIAGNVRTVSSKLASGEGTLGRLMSDDALYRDIQSVVQKAERTIDGLGEQGPITAVGIAANALF